MSFIAVVVLFPLLLFVLSLGSGLLIARISGARVPGLLLVPVGFGGLVVVSQFTTSASFSAPLTPWVLAVMALAGFALGGLDLREPWRAHARGTWLWFAAAAGLSYVLTAGPVIAAGRLTFPGYLLDTTAAIQLAGAERLLHHAHDFATAVPGYGTTLTNYFGNGYPSGGHTVFGAVGWLSGQDLLWLYAPFQAAELGISALVICFYGVRSGLPRAAAALTGLVASVPALVYSYALMGSVKELTALPMLLLMGGLMVLSWDRRSERRVRLVVPFGIAAAAAVGAIGLAAMPWVVGFALAGLLGAAPPIGRHEARRFMSGAALLAVSFLVLALPTVGRLSTALTLAQNQTSTNAAAAADPGNLLRPLKFVQSLGVWLGGTHRVDPKYFTETYALIGVVVVGLFLSIGTLMRRRSWDVIAVIVLSLLVWQVLTPRGTEWTDAKLLMLLSPVLVFAAMVGAWSRLGRRAFDGIVLATTIAGAVFASDALAYHGTNMAPGARYQELRLIGARFVGQGPTVTTDFDEYALYLLRNLRPDNPGLAYHGPFALVGTAPQYGHSYDIDAFSQPTLGRFRLIVMRRSPAWSRPPSNYALAFRGRYYTVWRLIGPPPKQHLAFGSLAAYQPSAGVSCRVAQRIARQALREQARLLFAQRPLNATADLAAALRSPLIVSVPDLEGRPDLLYGHPGRVVATVTVPQAGIYTLWIGVAVDRPLHVVVDGRLVGTPGFQAGGDGNMIEVATLSLRRGRHEVQLVRYGGTLNPGDDSATAIDAVILAPAVAEQEVVRTIDPSAWRSLCGLPLDWIELR